MDISGIALACVDATFLFHRPMDWTRAPLEQQLQHLQQAAFAYFQHETNPLNGLVKDKTAPDWPASIAATGMALASYPVAVERGLMTKHAAIQRTLNTLRFFWNSPQGPQADATGYRGFYYHFLDMQTGDRAGECELSTVDSAFLLAGALAAAEYFDADTKEQGEIRSLAEALYLRADWAWAQNGGKTITHGWTPENGFLQHRWEGYDEALLLYILGMGSPTHPLSAESYDAWASTYEWKNYYDVDYLHSPPLFTHQLSQAWIDFRGIQDAFMRSKGIDYFENSRRATIIQQRYAIDNPKRFAAYDSNSWGITASDGPGPASLKIDGIERRFYDYIGRGAPDGVDDDGTLSPWAVVASLPFAPEIVIPAIYNFAHTLELHDCNAYGFKSSFNATFKSDTDPSKIWISPFHFGLNLGPVILMIENYRSGLLWKLMRGNRWIRKGLLRAGFTGGWLQT